MDHLARTARRRMVGVRAIGVCVAVVALVCGTLAWTLRHPRLATWNPDFPLLLGEENNVKNGDTRAWDGTVSALHIASRAASIDDAKKLLSQGDFAAVMGDSAVAEYFRCAARAPTPTPAIICRT